MNIIQLNKRFGIGDQLNFSAEPHEFPLINIKNAQASAVICLYGAQVLSFQPKNFKQDLLFLSNKAVYQEGKAIRGGIPLCWPWFGAHPSNPSLGNHGVARCNSWHVESTCTLENGATQIRLSLLEDKTKLDGISLMLTITVDTTLSLELSTYNAGKDNISITQALHTYFRVSDIRQVTVFGLENTQYWDKLDYNALKTQSKSITIMQETDRIYLPSNNPLIIDDPSFKRQIHITSNQPTNAIVWNPWEKSATTLPDLAPEDYQQFICVEAGNVSESINILPNASFSLSTTFQLVDY